VVSSRASVPLPPCHVIVIVIFHSFGRLFVVAGFFFSKKKMDSGLNSAQLQNYIIVRVTVHGVLTDWFGSFIGFSADEVELVYQSTGRFSSRLSSMYIWPRHPPKYRILPQQEWREQFLFSIEYGYMEWVHP
jgi:hypothetical protein